MRNAKFVVTLLPYSLMTITMVMRLWTDGSPLKRSSSSGRICMIMK